MWILIMTMYIGYTPNIATAEFTSEEACRYGGAQQEIVLRNDFRVNTARMYTFICVKK